MPQVLLERRDNVAVVTLNDPDRRNALNLDMNAELGDLLDDVESDPDIGAIVVTGTPPAFCAGADLSQLGESQHDGLRAIYEGFLRVANSPLPTVAAIGGAAVGAGMNLALAADLRIAGPRARFDTRFLDLGIHPGGGHTWMMNRIVGPQVAAAMVLFGEILDGEEAVRAGLAWKCVAEDELLDEAVRLAGRAASGPPELVTRLKATLSDITRIDNHEEAVGYELEPQVWSINQPAFAERLAALQAKISSK